MAREWAEITNGAVRLRIYPGGIAGTGDDVIRKMRIGQIDMALLTSTSISTIIPDTFVMSLPFFLKSEAELDFMLERMTKTFDEDFHDKGFKMLGWSKSGWIYIYTNRKIRRPEELKTLKFAISPENQESINAFKEMGFNIIPLDMNDLLMGLQSGMVESFYTSPMAAAAYQWFALAPNMLNIRMSPLLGGIIVSERTWRRVPSRYREDLQENVESTLRNFYNSTLTMEEKAVNVMEDNGLEIINLSSSEEDEWITEIGGSYSVFVGEGKKVSPEVFTRYKNIIEEFRAR